MLPTAFGFQPLEARIIENGTMHSPADGIRRVFKHAANGGHRAIVFGETLAQGSLGTVLPKSAFVVYFHAQAMFFGRQSNSMTHR